MKIRSHTQLDVYKMSFKVAMILFELSRKFPIEERDTRSQSREFRISNNQMSNVER